MTVEHTPINDLIVITPKRFGDARGYFAETFRASSLPESAAFVQDNESMSRAGVLRGLHFQNPPHAQGKLVSCVRGSVYDVALDIRSESPTYGHWYGEILSAENMKRLWIPPGFAHGFLTLEDDTIFQYKCTDYYAPEAEGCIAWDSLDIPWEEVWKNAKMGDFDPNLSEKDQKGIVFADFTSNFK